MYAVRWGEERIIQGLAVLMCLALVGIVVIPTITAVNSYLAIACYKGWLSPETCLWAGIGVSVAGIAWTVVCYYFEIGAAAGIAGAVILGAIGI